jgi:hypothetical protein
MSPAIPAPKAMATKQRADHFFLRLFSGAIAILIAAVADAAGPRKGISEDRELKKINLAAWECRDHPEGSPKTPEDAERNRLKNRAAANLAGVNVAAFDTRSFLHHVAAFETQVKRKRRKDLTRSQRRRLEPFENQIVSLTGYLVIAYPGPPESTNCGTKDFHDWHLELFEKPLDHSPRIGDPTPIICEITPRTQNAIFHDHIRIQSLAGFVRAPDWTVEPTHHAARKIRVTGYLLWDDEHNGVADIGTTIRTIGANKYHHPWRSTPWEIHPVLKIEALDPEKYRRK